jgi:hypothetical protein
MLAGAKTRCRECIYAKSEATAEPCNKCNEILSKKIAKENHFISASDEESAQ